MPEEIIDPGLLEQTKNQIRKLVAEIADLAESDIQPNEFYVEFLNRSVAAVAATGGAFWMMDGRGGLRLQYQVEFGVTGLMDGRVKTAPHDALLGCMLQASQSQIIPPSAVIEGVPQAFNPTEFALIIAPLMVDKQVVGLLEILMDPTRRAAQQKSTLRFVSDLCDLAATYLKNRQMRQMMSQQRLWNQLEGFTHQIHGSLDLKETAYAVVNDGKRLVACDRLTRGAQDRRPDDGRGGQRPGGRRTAVQPGARADPALQGRDPFGRRPGLYRQHRRPGPRHSRRARDVRRRIGVEGRRRHALAQARDDRARRPRTRPRRRSRSAAWWPSRSATSWRRRTCTPGPRSSRGTPRRRSGMPRNTTRSS